MVPAHAQAKYALNSKRSPFHRVALLRAIKACLGSRVVLHRPEDYNTTGGEGPFEPALITD